MIFYLFSSHKWPSSQPKGIFFKGIRYFVLALLTLSLVQLAHVSRNQVQATVDSSVTEKIFSFNSDITIKSDGSMVVEETITVEATGEQIKRLCFTHNS